MNEFVAGVRRLHRDRGLLALFLSLLLIAFNSRALAQGRGELIREIRFQGLRRVGPDYLLARIESREGAPFDPDVMSADVKRLYATEAFEGQGEEPAVRVRAERLAGGGVRILFTVNERPVLAAVRILSAKDFKPGEIEEAVRSAVGQPYDAFRAKRDADRLQQTLVDLGYVFASVSYRTQVRAPGLVELIFEPSSGPQVVVDSLQFSGINFLEDPEDLIEIADLKCKPERFWGLGEDGYFVRSKLDGDIKQIELFFRSRGFLDAQATLEKLDFTADQSRVTIVIKVLEGPRYAIRKIDIRGNLAFSRREIREELKLAPGRPFLGNELLQDVEAIQRLYSSKAHIHAKARFELVFDRERHLLDILYTVTEGPKVRVERIEVEGNEKTKDKVIRRNLAVVPGELFDSDKLELSLGRLGRLRYFEDIKLDFRPGTIDDGDPETESEDLVLQLKEARTGSFVIGGGISTNAGFFGNIVLSQRNFDITDVPTSIDDITSGRAFTGAGQNFTIQAQPGRERSQYRVSFTDPYFLDTPLILGLQGFIFDRIRPDYREGRLGFIPRLGYLITPDLTLSLSHRLERVRIFDIDEDSIPDPIRVSGNNLVSGMRLELGLDRNLVDTQFVQYEGYGASIAYEVLGGPFGGEVTLSRAEAEANWQTTLFEFPRKFKWVVGARGSVGWQEPYGRDSFTPIFERYFAGGVRSFRGFEFRSVSPRDPVQRDEPVGGDFQVLGTVDFSFPIFKGFLRGVIFSDMGTVEKDIREFRLRRVRYTAGFGFRVNVAIFPAPVALDFAFPIRARRIDDEQVFSFSVGVGF